MHYGMLSIYFFIQYINFCDTFYQCAAFFTLAGIRNKTVSALDINLQCQQNSGALMNKSIIAFLNGISTAGWHYTLGAMGEGIKQFNGIISTDE